MDSDKEISLLRVILFQKYDIDFIWLFEKWSKQYTADPLLDGSYSFDKSGVLIKEYKPTNFAAGKSDSGVYYVILWRFALAYKNQTAKIPFNLDKNRVSKLISMPIGGSRDYMEKIKSTLIREDT